MKYVWVKKMFATAPFYSHVYGPAVRALFEQYSISENDVPGTGPHGRILKG